MLNNDAMVLWSAQFGLGKIQLLWPLNLTISILVVVFTITLAKGKFYFNINNKQTVIKINQVLIYAFCESSHPVD